MLQASLRSAHTYDKLTEGVLHTGLLHFNHNKQCTPLVFTQTFNSADPGALNVVGALAALSSTAGSSIAASNVTAGASPQKAFALDQVSPSCTWHQATCKPNLDLSKLVLCIPSV